MMFIIIIIITTLTCSMCIIIAHRASGAEVNSLLEAFRQDAEPQFHLSY